MNIEEKLRNIPQIKGYVELLQKEYNNYFDMLEMMKKINSESSQKLEKLMNNIYNEIQQELDEYKTTLAAVKQLSDFKQMLIHFHYFDKKPLKQISEMMNYKYSFLYDTKISALKDLENILSKR